jgi:cyclohexanecarboxylate-CoA ligase
VLVPGAAGMRTVLMAKWDPERALQLVRDERITFMVGPPTFFVQLMAAPGFGTDTVAPLRLVSSGGSGVTPAFVEEATTRLGARVKRSYGSTEAPTITSSGAHDSEQRAAETDGRPVGECELRIARDGELLVRGPELFAGYADAEQTRAAVTRGWFATGDLATVDGEGWLTIVGRKKDVIIRGGENIAAGEVEELLVAHPAVREAVAVGYPDERYGERVCAFVLSDQPFDLETCRAWFAARGAARFKTPEQVVQVDAFPVLAAGKVDRAALRERAAANFSRL